MAQGIGVTIRTKSGVQPMCIVLAMRLYPRPVQQLLQLRRQLRLYAYFWEFGVCSAS